MDKGETIGWIGGGSSLGWQAPTSRRTSPLRHASLRGSSCVKSRGPFYDRHFCFISPFLFFVLRPVFSFSVRSPAMGRSAMQQFQAADQCTCLRAPRPHVGRIVTCAGAPMLGRSGSECANGSRRERKRATHALAANWALRSSRSCPVGCVAAFSPPQFVDSMPERPARDLAASFRFLASQSSKLGEHGLRASEMVTPSLSETLIALAPRHLKPEAVAGPWGAHRTPNSVLPLQRRAMYVAFREMRTNRFASPTPDETGG